MGSNIRWSAGVLLSSALLSACSLMPTAGPSRRQVEAAPEVRLGGIQLVDIDETVARRLLSRKRSSSFADTMTEVPRSRSVGAGDVLEVTVWEAPPAMLFAALPPDVRGGASGGRGGIVFPEQTVGWDGRIRLPFAGEIVAAGRELAEIEVDIVRRLAPMANRPQAMVRLLRNGSSTVTVVGEVVNSLRVPLTPAGERLLDALAAAGGVRQPINKITLQLTRGHVTAAMPLDTVIRDPRQNVLLAPGDVVTAVHQPLSFSALGATGKNEEVNFEASGISLAQAMARSGGLADQRADVRGLFIFRFESADTLDWPTKPVQTTADGKVPVIYRLDLSSPAGFLIAQRFAVESQDVLYASNAPLTDLQKFSNVILPLVYPAVNLAR